MAETRDISYYRQLPYRRIVDLIEDDDQDYFVARVKDLPWIQIHGETHEDALHRLDEIFDDCIQSILDDDGDIPEPVAWPADIGYVPEQGVVGIGVALEQSVTFTDPEDADPWTPVGVEDDDRRLVVT